ncbi:MAG: sugar phosphate isomerase/epimerase family protein [Christensenellaceae bacterium]
MKKVSIGSWAYVFGAFEKNPILLPQLCDKLSQLGFDGISLGGFAPHANPDLYDTDAKRAELKALLKAHNLEIADFACDLWSLDSLKQTEEWIALFEKNAKFAQQMGFSIIRVDSGTPPILPEGMSYDDVKKAITAIFKRIAKIAQKYNLQVVWEFEPGFMINEPKNVVAVAKAVDEPNFHILFDTCHAHMGAVVGARHIEKDCKLAGGVEEYAKMCKDMIGIVHVIDSDGTLNVAQTSTHAPFGLGVIDFDSVIPALLNDANYKGDWWAIDLCEWPDAWQATADCKKFVDQFNAKYCG